MANEVVIATLSPITITSTGGATASNAFTSAGSYAASSHSGYTGSDVVFTGSFTGAVSLASNYLSVYVRPLSVEGSNSAPTPSAAYTGGFVGALVFASSASGGTQTAILQDVPNSWANVELYIENRTNSSLASNWTMKVIPKTVKPL